MEYELDNLIVTFKRHAEEFEKYQKENPNPNIETFNLPRAFLCFANELKNLKDKSND